MKNEYLRHTLATIQYRLKKALTFWDEELENFSLGKGSRSPKEILMHMTEVLNWTIRKIDDSIQIDPVVLSYNGETVIKTFFKNLIILDDLLTENELDADLSKILLQGPLADILTHIGQIAMLSRMNDHPIDKEDFSKAFIKAGVHQRNEDRE